MVCRKAQKKHIDIYLQVTINRKVGTCEIVRLEQINYYLSIDYDFTLTYNRLANSEQSAYSE
jgi:hypothetical protein